ncbi:MAG: deoxynucleoside kinase [Patescibacteria group bacterium]|nr:deoxynucleoside kinase [Patescibacteria group bacterium]
MTKNKKGKLIVIDGTDGSGKATQVALLMKRLKKDGYTVKMVDFPEYYKNFFGKFIGHCLTEQYYNWTNVHPKIASIAYAADRWESSKNIRKWIDKGYMVIANRYVSANQIHQGGKIKNAKKRQAFIEWLDEMEYKVFKIPRPDLTMYLSVPIGIVERLMKERNKKSVRNYAGKKKDVHEVDKDFQKNSIASALWLVKNLKNFTKIDCAPKGELLPREVIHEEIYKKVKKLL